MKEINKPKILYVDDEKDNLIVFKSSFRRYYEVFTTTSAHDGLKIIQEHDIAVVLTDQRMPGMTGIEFLKKLPENLQAPRIILTGYSDVSTIIEAINSAKVYKYVTKPWDRDKLKMNIDNALEALELKRKNANLIEELQHINEQLEQKVIDRTHELESALQEISKQKKELEQLNDTKDKFFSIVAHDLRSPINTLCSFSNILSLNSSLMTPGEISKYSKDINHSTENALNLIDNLLTWASSQMNRVEFNPTEINVKPTVEKVLAQLNNVASNKKIRVKTSINSTVQVFADKDHLMLILRNLIGNALKYTKEGGRVIISSKNTSPSKTEIKVTDTGVGMNELQLSSLLQLDSKQQNTTGTAGEKGTGLGLILCQEFLEKNNGSIDISSSEGKGSTFTVTLQRQNILKGVN